MSKQVNPNIGHINCALCKRTSALRKDKNNKLYYDCLNCGRIAPNHSGGQAMMKEHPSCVIWGPSGPPAGVPRWIADEWPYAVAIKNHDVAMLPREDATSAEERAVARPVSAPDEGLPPPGPPAEQPKAPPKLPDMPPPPPAAKPDKKQEPPPDPQPADVGLSEDDDDEDGLLDGGFFS